MREVLPFILCGGVGTRLWPLSREAFPKQFQKIGAPLSLFQQTCRRLQGETFGEPYVLSNRLHRFLVAEQLAEIGAQSRSIVLEPTSRNTAPAACIAALIAARTDPNALVLLAPADHFISDAVGFERAIARGLDAARNGALVTFGVEPDCPHTGYGYIETEESDTPDLKVMRFVEKPSKQAAEKFLESGRFFWNAGIFLFKSSALVSLFEVHAPEILEACRQSLGDAKDDLGFLLLSAAYAKAPSISLDYAIAEKTHSIRCVPLDTPWSDVGSWSAVWSALEKDSAENVVLGDGEIIFQDTTRSLAYSEIGCLALVGLDGVVVVATDDAVLVVSKDYAESVKTVVERLKIDGQTHALEHTRVYRPWGWYQTLNRGDRYQVKCIMVKPGGTLSLQSHFHRSEHWVVVTGTLEVTRGEQVELLSENQSTFIAIGEKHRLANPGRIPAFLIEVQSGSYLNEDDIVRFEDLYHRSSAD